MTLRVVDPSGGPRALMLAYCEARGISEAQADAAGFKPLDAATTMARAGSANALGRCSFEIPYYDLDGKPTGHSRLKFLGEPSGFKPTKERKRALKFWQEPESGTPAYIPPGFARSIASDPSLDVYVTEGEIKSLAAMLRGIPTIAIGGVDTWHVGGDKERLVPGLDSIVLPGRNVGIVFDSDAATNPDVQRAEAALCAELARPRRGAFPQVIRLPPTKDGGKHGLDDFLVAEGPEAFRRLVDGTDRLPDALDTGTTLLDTPYPPIEFAIKPYLPKGEVVELHGAHGIGKSAIALYAALSVATGEQWNSPPKVKRLEEEDPTLARPAKGRAAFISLEDKAPTIRRRVDSWIKGGVEQSSTIDAATRARRRAGVRENFLFLGREKAAPLVLTGTEFGQVHVRKAAVDRLVKLCAGLDLVVLETTSRLHPAGETNDALAVFAGALETIATRTGASVVLVRHIAKAQARDGEVDSYGGRGGGALADAARSVLSVVREGDGPVQLFHTKSTHTARGPELVWRFEQDGPSSFYLRPLDAKARELAIDHRILHKIREAGSEGIKARDVQRSLSGPSKMAAPELQAVLARLVKEGLVTATPKPAPKGQVVVMYRDAGVVEPDAS